MILSNFYRDSRPKYGSLSGVKTDGCPSLLVLLFKGVDFIRTSHFVLSYVSDCGSMCQLFLDYYILKAADPEHFPDTKLGAWVQVLKCENLDSELWKKVLKGRLEVSGVAF
jgi:hypothetical protein